MVKSMFAGVAGLRAHQSKMDIIGNNIANVNTWGYKSASMSFKDAMYQSTSTGSGGNTTTGGYGGTNANQIGLGVSTGAITYDFSAGGMSPSSRALDCMIDGDGFFIVGPMVSGGSVPLDSEDSVEKSGLYLSRVGIFNVDNNGYLIDDGGNYVYGFVNGSDDLTKSDTFDTASLQPLKIPTSNDLASINNGNASDKVANAKKAYEEAQAMLNKMQNAFSLAQQEYVLRKGDYDAAKAGISGTANLKSGDTFTYTSLDSGDDSLVKFLEKYKADMETAYAEWTANPSDPAKLDAYKKAKMNYDQVNNIYITEQASLKAPVAKDELTRIEAGETQSKLTKALEAYLDAQNTYLGTGDDATKKTMEEAKTVLEELQAKLMKIEDDSPEGKKAAAEQGKEAADAKVKAAETSVKNAKTAWETAQKAETSTQVDNADADDGLAELENYKIQEDGTLVGTTKDTGITVVIGKVALAAVQNSSGLVKDSGYYYSTSANSGKVSTYEAGGKSGKILGNFREMSKVDLATELTEMITTQRGFQANSKIITVTDSMLEELVNMKR